MTCLKKKSTLNYNKITKGMEYLNKYIFETSTNYGGVSKNGNS